LASSIINIRVDLDKRNELDALAAATGRSRNFLISEAIGRYLEEEAWQVGKIMQGLADADAGRVHEDDEVELEMRQIIARSRSVHVNV
jgi:RHH-type transcriptional regulator, rel operon repressor / antitoxin RelB